MCMDAAAQKNRQDCGIFQGQMDIRLYQPQVVNHPRDGCQIDRAMQHRPALAAHSANPPCCGREGQRDHQDEASETHRDVAPLHHVCPDAMKIEDLVKRQIDAEMAASVKKCEKAKHAPETNQLRLAE